MNEETKKRQAMTSREVVRRTILFEGVDRLPYCLAPKYGSDFVYFAMTPSPVDPPPGGRGVDEWGAVWENIGNTKLGEVKDFPLKDWKDFDKLNIPDVKDPKRWAGLDNIREKAGDKFLVGYGFSLYTQIHFVRGLENTWMDIYEHRDELERFIDVLVDMSIEAIKRYADLGADGYYFCDDWGLQDKLMISPAAWREIWKPRYARVFKAAHRAGLLVFFHSCGYIVDILDDLIEIHTDVMQMDQQENMGLELLGERFGGRIAFFCPVDVQNTMINGTLDEIRAYCRKMVKCLGRDKGGFICKYYLNPEDIGHRPQAIDAMCEEFLRLSREHYGL